MEENMGFRNKRRRFASKGLDFLEILEVRTK